VSHEKLRAVSVPCISSAVAPSLPDLILVCDEQGHFQSAVNILEAPFVETVVPCHAAGMLGLA